MWSAFRLSRRWQTLLRLLFSLLVLLVLSTRLDWESALSLLQQAEPLGLLGALLAFNLSQGVSAERLRWLLQPLQVPLERAENLRLYYVGMFYNLLLPGGISGDAIKIHVLRQRQPASWGRYLQVFLQDRLNGLVALSWWAGFWGWWLQDRIPGWLVWGGLVGLLLGSWLYGWGQLRWFPESRPVLVAVSLASLLVQGLQLGSVMGLCLALGLVEPWSPYLLLFLVSSVAAVLPISVGGLGLRELVFFVGAPWLGVDAEGALLVSLGFYLITVTSALVGLGFRVGLPEAIPSAEDVEQGHGTTQTVRRSTGQDL